MSLFTTCLITVSTESRAQEYRTLIDRRKSHGLYPAEIDFKVYSDPQSGRIGSGGAVLNALYQFSMEKRSGDDKSQASSDTGRILLLNAGGEADALTTFSSEGIPFIPVPVDSSSTIQPVMLDLQLDMFLKYPWKENEIVIAPADIFLVCDPAQFSVKRGDIHGYAFAAAFEKGASHGVFCFDQYMHSVTGYYQKSEVSFLKKSAAIEGTDTCAVDTGILSLSPAFVNALFELAMDKHDGKKLIDKVMSGDVGFDLYRELITAALGKEQRESEKNSVDPLIQDALYQKISTYIKSFTLTATLLKNVEFFHLDTLREYLDLCSSIQARQTALWYTGQFAELRVKNMSGWITFSCNQVRMPLRKGTLSLIEGSAGCIIENALGGNIFSGITDWQTDISIPEGFCIDCRAVDNSNVFLIYNTSDHFSKKGTVDTLTLCGVPLKKWLSQRYLTLSDIGITQELFKLSDAKLFRADTSDDFLSGYWNVPSGTQWKEKFCASLRFSLSDCSTSAIAHLRDLRRQQLRSTVLHSLILQGRGWVGASSSDFREAFRGDRDNSMLEAMYEKTGDVLTKNYRGRLLDCVQGGRTHSGSIGFYQKNISAPIAFSTYALNKDQTIVVRCPVRIDLAGGWSDMPPFTLKHGGAVVNMSVNLRGIEPISVYLRRIDENVIRIHSIDKEILYTCSEFNHFETAPKGCDLIVNALHYVGFNRQAGDSLKAMLQKAGGGFEITTICAVPRNSGLGGSSILTAAALGSLNALFGKELSWEQLLNDTILIEQFSGAGSGWQDISGGIYGGLKLLQSVAGHFPQLKISRLNADLLTDQRTKSCFTLVNTGIKRPSLPVSQLVSDLMNENIPSYEYSLQQLKTLAIDASEAVSASDLTALSSVINKYRSTNTQIHPFLSSSEAELFFKTVDSFYSGVKFAGAGGGGYALFISETAALAEQLRQAISGLNNPDVSIVDFSLNTKGISVTIL
jgi:galactokinase/mevalonate kinase-like predicted kinase